MPLLATAGGIAILYASGAASKSMADHQNLERTAHLAAQVFHPVKDVETWSVTKLILFYTFS